MNLKNKLFGAFLIQFYENWTFYTPTESSSPGLELALSRTCPVLNMPGVILAKKILFAFPLFNSDFSQCLTNLSLLHLFIELNTLENLFLELCPNERERVELKKSKNKNEMTKKSKRNDKEKK